jgi:uncharacterized membrane protein YkoI
MNLIYALIMVGTTSSVFTGMTLFSNFLTATPNLSTIYNKIHAMSQQEKIDRNSFDLTREHIPILPHEAIDVAIKKISAQPFDVKSIALENEDGHIIYSVYIYKADSNSQLVDINVDAVNGKVLTTEYDLDDYDLKV